MERLVKNFVLATSLVTLMAATGAHADAWEVELGGGIMLSQRDSTDTDIVGSPFKGAFLEGYGATDIGGLRFAIDGRVEVIDDEGRDDVYETGPVHSGVLGLHLGKEVNGNLVGGYVAVGMFDGSVSDSPMRGWTAGIEAERALGNGAIYGQLGYVRAVGDEGDNEFDGANLRVGYTRQFNDSWSGMAAIEVAHSGDCFEDCGGDWGRAVSAEFGVTYSTASDWDLTGSLRFTKITANTEDEAHDKSLYLGVSKSFGGKPTSSSLRTPMGGFRAAGWMAPLD